MPSKFDREERSTEAFSMREILDGLLRRREMQPGVRAGRLRTAWPAIVGEKLAEHTAPKSLENGVLTVIAANGAWATQLRFLAEEIRSRAETELGEGSVRRVNVTVGQLGSKPL
jgi:predicted nucleic acid-binding Zn ribbon protein